MPEIGQTLSHFKITDKIGAGGMGTVFLAEDLTLDRKVALKFLQDAFTSDPERMARFEREAKLLASLNHPNIAGIYGLEQADGNRFLVLEYVEGETLQARLSKGALPLEEALELCRQIAEGLEAAHEKGVIHRDLKPANVMIAAEEKVKILDFGLAKAFSDDTESIDSSQSPTLTEAMTRPGVILGTAAYMSPEQAKGKSVDKRADIWAFGCILYECLTGKKAFEGETVTETLAAILRGEPDWNRLPSNIHPRICLLLERCLEKHSKDRYGVINDARVDIQKVLVDPSGVFAQPVIIGETRTRMRTILPWIATAIVITGVAVWLLKPSPPPELKQVIRSEYVLPEDQQFNISPITGVAQLAVSPDGSQFVYSTTNGLFLRSMNELTAKHIAGTDRYSFFPFFSPNGEWIGYWSQSDQKLNKVRVRDGTPVPLCDTEAIFFGASWNTDETIVYSDFGTIKRVSTNGGTPKTLVEANPLAITEDGVPILPQMLPDGDTLLFTNIFSTTDFTNSEIVVQSLQSGDRKILFNGGIAEYLPTGYIVYALSNNLFAVRFDYEKREITSDHASVRGEFGVVSDSGTHVYVPATTVSEGSTATPQRTLVWVDREGNEESLNAPPDGYQWCRISPDGNKLALSVESGGRWEIWIWDLDREILSRLTLDEAYVVSPIWSLDSQRIFFFSSGEGGTGIYWKASNNTGAVEKLFSLSPVDRYIFPFSWSPDENTLVIQQLFLSPVHTDIAILSMEDDRKITPLLQGQHSEYYPQISPDGKWMAYTSNENGQIEVYVCSFPDVNKDKRQVSSGGGHSPLWSSDGNELFYCQHEEIMSVKIKTDPKLNPGKPKVLFRKTYYYDISYGGISAGWDIHPDEDRFLMIKPPDVTEEESSEEPTVEEPRKIIFVQNWLEELKEKVPVP